MPTHVSKTQENKSQAHSHTITEKQGIEPSSQFVDTRAHAITQKQFLQKANDSNQVSQLRAFQNKASYSAQANQLQTYQLKANVYGSSIVQQLSNANKLSASEHNEPIQRMDSEANAAVTTKNNTGLPDHLKQGIESLSGMSLDNVKVHYNSAQPARVNAQAYAQGTNIHIAPGREQHLAHEAWHVVQQAQGRVRPTMQMKGGVAINDDVALEKEADVMGAKAMQMPRQASIESQASSVQKKKNDEASASMQTSASNSSTNNYAAIHSPVTNVVQRDIGFEFESQLMGTKKTNTGAIPGVAFANGVVGAAAYNAVTSTRVNKGDALLDKPDIEVQADDANFGGNSDLEVVTTHFPLDIPGRARLDQAMTDLDTLIAAYTPLYGTGGGYVPASALNGTAGFNNGMNDAIIIGNWVTATTAGQVTLGTRLGNIGDIVKDLHGAPGETLGEKAARDPGRLHLRRPDIVNPLEPRALNATEESSTLINGYALAQNTLAQYQINNPLAPGGSALEGILTIIFTYCESMQHKQAFLKNHTPLMAKTNLATMFNTLPLNVKNYYSQKNWRGRSNLELLIRTAPGYAARMNRPLFDGVGGLHEDNRGPGQRQWYHRLSLSSWIDGIVLRDRTLMEAINDGFNANTKRPGTDKLTNASFPNKPANQEVEGYGALGVNMDTHIGTGDALPVFELRSANRPITFNAAHQWALDFFDYVESLNDNPGGGHARM